MLHDNQCQCTSYCNLVSIPATPVRWTSTNHNFAVPSEANSTFVVGVHKVISTGNWLTVKCISLGTMSSSNTLLTTTLSFFIPFATISLFTFTTHGSHTQLQTPNQLSAASPNCLMYIAHHVSESHQQLWFESTEYKVVQLPLWHKTCSRFKPTHHNDLMHSCKLLDSKNIIHTQLINCISLKSCKPELATHGAW